MFSWRNKKNIMWIPFLISSYVNIIKNNHTSIIGTHSLSLFYFIYICFFISFCRHTAGIGEGPGSFPRTTRQLSSVSTNRYAAPQPRVRKLCWSMKYWIPIIIAACIPVCQSVHQVFFLAVSPGLNHCLSVCISILNFFPILYGLKGPYSLYGYS